MAKHMVRLRTSINWILVYSHGHLVISIGFPSQLGVYQCWLVRDFQLMDDRHGFTMLYWWEKASQLKKPPSFTVSYPFISVDYWIMLYPLISVDYWWIMFYHVISTCICWSLNMVEPPHVFFSTSAIDRRLPFPNVGFGLRLLWPEGPVNPRPRRASGSQVLWNGP